MLLVVLLLYLIQQLEADKNLINELEQKQKSTKRLVEKREVSPIELNEVKIQMLEQQIEYEKNISTNTAIAKAIKALTTD